MGALHSVAAVTAQLLGPDGCRYAVESLTNAAYVTNHLPSALVQANMPAGAQAIMGEEYYTRDEQNGWTWGNHPKSTQREHEELRRVVEANRDAFAFSTADLPGYHGEVGPFRIKLTTADPIISPPRRYSPIERQVMHEKCVELNDSKIIRPAAGTQCVSAPVVSAKKDAEGNWTDKRFCIDSRGVNKHSETDKYSTRLPEEMFTEIGKSGWFSKIDLRSGFHQIPIADEDQEKTTFWWENRTYCYTRMSFGLQNATAHFQRVMDHEILKAGLQGNACCYVDDVLVHSRSHKEHLKHVERTLRMLHDCGLRAHPEKSVFGASSLEFLGHVVSPYGTSPHAAKVAAIQELPAPTNVSELRSVLGFCNYYRCYVPNYSAIVHPLNRLLAKDAPWSWTPECAQAFQDLKKELCTEGRALKRADPERPYVLYTDWSKQGIGAVLAQVEDDGREYMVACVSRSLNKHEANYSSYEGEALACVWACKTLRPYLHGVPFAIVTDHQPLCYLMTNQNLTGKHARWALSLQEFEFTVTHRPGKKHCNADVPSRFPRGSAFDGTGARLDGDPEDAAYSTPDPHLAHKPVSELAKAAHCFALNPIESTYVEQTTENREAVTCAAGAAAPHHEDMLHGNLHAHDDSPYTETSAEGCHAEQLREMARAAAVQAVARAHNYAHTTPSPGAYAATPLTQKPAPAATSLDTTPVPSSFFTRAVTEGVVLMELCGGIGAGLEATLRNGIKIKHYLYADTDPAARVVTKHRFAELAAQYPNQLSPTLVTSAFCIPQDIRELNLTHLQEALSEHKDTPWLVVAGWPCQDLSPAGPGAGLQGSRSSLFYDVLRILTELQKNAEAPVAYLLENAAVQHNFRPTALTSCAYQELTNALGIPACLDAAQFNSHAHRLRNYWSNLANMTQVQLAAHCWHRTPGLLVDHILEPHHKAQIARRDDAPPFYPANKKGAPLSALPTLVAYGGSHAFRDGRVGMVLDTRTHTLVEPNADERERALGYRTGCTDVPGVPQRKRCELLGNCIDQNALQALIALCRAVNQLSPVPHPPALVTVTPSSPLGGGVRTHQQEQQTSSGLQGDIWNDAGTLHYLKEGTHDINTGPTEAKRIQRRATAYTLIGGRIFRCFKDGSQQEVPEPSRRAELVKAAHNSTGHFGVSRTTSMLKTNFWWYGMREDVGHWVAQCEVCARLNTSFDAPASQLRPLPIHGLFYRWGVDLAGPLPKSEQGNVYVMVCVEHFSKTMVLCPLPNKEPASTAAAFLAHVLSRYGSCAEVLTDGGGEFQGEFQALMRDALIDHRTTRPNNPQADGLAERCVQTFKRALSKCIEQAQDATKWDTDLLPWIGLGYNSSTQQATGFSPYYLLHGVEPVVPPAIKERMSAPMELLDDDQLALQLQLRAAAVRQAGVVAGGNLLIAQHRDTLRYATIRSGTYHPRLRRYAVGDYVYVRVGEPNNKLDMSHYNHILRVVELTAAGNLVLQGACGRTMTTNVTNVSPCHLPFIDESPLTNPARPPANLPCEVCGFPDREDVMLLCDACNTGWHIDCLTPALPAVPDENEPWVCPRCTALGVVPENMPPPHETLPEPRRQSVMPSTRQRQADKHAKALHGRRIIDGSRPGTVRFVSAERRPYYFAIEYDDGTREVEKSLTYVRRRLLPEGAMACVLSGSWTLTDPRGVEFALQQLMPGTWDPRHISRLANLIKDARTKPELAPMAPTTPGEVRALLELLDFSQIGTVVDPWAGTGTIKAELNRHGIPVVSNDLNFAYAADMHEDALQPVFYQRVSQLAPIDVVVTSPWFAILDLALPLVVAAARMLCCVHVPGHYLTDAHPMRTRYLTGLMKEGRVHVLWNLPKGPMGRRCGWLLVFADACTKQLLMKAGNLPHATHSYAI